ncbi:tubulin-specific chaperone A-like [Argopecten irradians]|uniref:tubulin-specific chaperone A-like n=1 Tax=Argopecten irradians TaxID=31199 RepID=UPI00371A9645
MAGIADPKMKQLKIKTGVVKRITKEKFMYEKESQKEADKVEKMKAEGKDEYDIRKQQEVQEESQQMVPETMGRLRKGLQDLEAHMKQVEGDLKETDEYKLAVTVCEEARKAME